MGSYHELFSPIQDQLGHSEQWQKFLFHSAEKANRSLADIYGVKSTLRALPNKIPAVFSRDRDTSEQVWSGEKGYPGDSHYLEFHKKHHNSGLRYWKITGTKIDIGQKEQYDPKATEKIVSRHAEHFIQLVREGLKRHAAQAGSIGVVCSPFDTELFGHWWFEGPTFLEKVLKLLSHDSEIVLTNCSEAIDLLPQPRKIIALPEGSWGEGGGHYVWLNQDVAWTWDDIYKFEKQFLTILSDYRKERKPSKFLTKLLKQAARELLLVEASDWQFLITTKSASEYSTKRFKTHCKRLAKLLKIADRILNGKDKKDKDEKYLEKVSIDDRPFAEIDLGWWR